MGAHALLSPSSSKKWMTCPGSLGMEYAFPNESSVYADEGTAAHELASATLDYGAYVESQGLLRNPYGLTAPTRSLDCEVFRGQILKVGDNEFEIDDDMIENVQRYVDLVREYADGHTLMVEQRLSLTEITGEINAFGTSDVVILTADGTTMIVVDLKYGRGVEVSAEDNPQLKIYALAALREFDVMGTIEKIRMVIHQPRVGGLSEVEIPVGDLMLFGGKVKVHASTALIAYEHRSNWMKFDADGNFVGDPSYLEASSEGCRWCRAKSLCPVLARFVEDTAGEGFEDMTDIVGPPLNPMEMAQRVPDIGNMMVGHAITGEMVDAPLVPVRKPVTLSQKMQAIPLLEAFISAVRAEVERELFAGRPVEGFKLVAGRKPARKWGDVEAVATELARMRLKVEDTYTKKLNTPPVLEKLLKDTPKRWDRLAKLIVQGEPKPSVAPEHDKRPALVLAASDEGFGVIPEPETTTESQPALPAGLDAAAIAELEAVNASPNPEDISDLM